MGHRSVALSPKRIFGGLAALLAALVLLGSASSPASAAGGEAAEAYLAASLSGLPSRDVYLTARGDLEGSSVSDYSSTARFLRVPCPGRYRYLLESEDRFTGASSTVAATVLLTARPGAAESARCGMVAPPRPGTALVAIAGAEEPLRLVGSRGAAGAFRGELTLGTEPQCGESYTLEVDLDLRGWQRTVAYRMDVLAVTVAIQGRDEPRLGC